MICKICREEFTPGRNHPGYINVCLDTECRAKAKEPQLKAMTVTVDCLVTFDGEVEL
jgi:hypothetical protein